MSLDTSAALVCDTVILSVDPSYVDREMIEKQGWEYVTPATYLFRLQHAPSGYSSEYAFEPNVEATLDSFGVTMRDDPWEDFRNMRAAQRDEDYHIARTLEMENLITQLHGASQGLCFARAWLNRIGKELQRLDEGENSPDTEQALQDMGEATTALDQAIEMTDDAADRIPV